MPPTNLLQQVEQRRRSKGGTPWQTYGGQAQPAQGAPNVSGAASGAASDIPSQLSGYPSWWLDTPSGQNTAAYYSAQNQPAPTATTATGPTPWTSGSGSFQDWFMGQLTGKPFNQQTLLDMEDLLGQSGSKLTPANAQGERTKIWDPVKKDWVRVGFGEGTPQWIYQGWGENGPQAGGGAGGGTFSDPATAQWEQLLRQLVDRLNQPQPTYTDAQRDLMQTQAIDPLERSRQAQRQNTTERFASRGINPGSGVLEQALQDVDRQFDQMKTGQQSQFALNQVNREDQMFNSNEQRALAGLNLFSQIPQYADKRLQMAQGSLMGGANPLQLLSMMNTINQQGQGQQNYNQMQDQQFWNWLGQMLSNSFGGR